MAPSATEGWIAGWLREHGETGGRDPADMIGEDFLELGMVSSLALIELVAALEDEFGIRLEAEQMQEQRFRTIGGLAAIVDEARGA